MVPPMSEMACLALKAKRASGGTTGGFENKELLKNPGTAIDRFLLDSVDET